MLQYRFNGSEKLFEHKNNTIQAGLNDKLQMLSKMALHDFTSFKLVPIAMVAS